MTKTQHRWRRRPNGKRSFLSSLLPACTAELVVDDEKDHTLRLSANLNSRCCRPRASSSNRRRRRPYYHYYSSLVKPPTPLLLLNLMALLCMLLFSTLLSTMTANGHPLQTVAGTTLKVFQSHPQDRLKLITGTPMPLPQPLLMPSAVSVSTNQEKSTIKLVKFQVAPRVRIGELSKISCQYDLHGATLHAVKLFKDGTEFYRYLPNDQRIFFDVPGVHMDQTRSNRGDVFLRIRKNSSGLYKCQVQVEDSFHSVSSEKSMEVISGSYLDSSKAAVANGFQQAFGGPGGGAHLAGEHTAGGVWSQQRQTKMRPGQALINNTNSNSRHRNLHQQQQQQQQPHLAVQSSNQAFHGYSSSATATLSRFSSIYSLTLLQLLLPLIVTLVWLPPAMAQMSPTRLNLLAEN